MPRRISVSIQHVHSVKVGCHKAMTMLPLLCKSEPSLLTFPQRISEIEHDSEVRESTREVSSNPMATIRPTKLVVDPDKNASDRPCDRPLVRMESKKTRKNTEYRIQNTEYICSTRYQYKT